MRVIRGRNLPIAWPSSGVAASAQVSAPAFRNGLRAGGHGGQDRLQVHHQRAERVDAERADAVHVGAAVRIPGVLPRLVVGDAGIAVLEQVAEIDGAAGVRQRAGARIRHMIAGRIVEPYGQKEDMIVMSRKGY